MVSCLLLSNYRKAFKLWEIVEVVSNLSNAETI